MNPYVSLIVFWTVCMLILGWVGWREPRFGVREWRARRRRRAAINQHAVTEQGWREWSVAHRDADVQVTDDA